MSRHLDKRQRAMLREMGVRVWLPVAAAPQSDVAIDSIADGARSGPVTGGFDPITIASSRPVVPLAQVAVREAAPSIRPAEATARPQAEARETATPGAATAWRMGDAQALYAE